MTKKIKKYPAVPGGCLGHFNPRDNDCKICYAAPECWDGRYHPIKVDVQEDEV